MNRRLWQASLALGLALTAEPTLSLAKVQESPEGRLEAYLDALGRLREGEAGAADDLTRIARALCELDERCDALAVAAYYTGLSPAELARGLEDEDAFFLMREEVVDASEVGLPEGSDWSTMRARLCRDLEAFANDVEGRADYTPAARAWALLARLEMHEVQKGTLSARELAPRIERAERHVSQSVALFERAGFVNPRLEPLWVRGRLARARHDRAAARADFEGCRSLAASVDNLDYVELALLGLVDLAKDSGDMTRVDALLADLASFRDPHESWPLAREHAGRLIYDDRPETALAFLLEHAPSAGPYEREWRGLLGFSFLRSGDLASAQREIDAMDDAGGEFAALSRATLRLASGDAVGVVEELDGDPRIATWSAQGRVNVNVLLGEAWLERGRADLALPALQSALREGERQEQRTDEATGSVLGEWVGLHSVALLARAYAELDRGLDAAATIEGYQSRRLRTRDAVVDADEVARWAERFELGLVTWGIGSDSGVVAWVPNGAGNGSTRAEDRPHAEAIPVGRRRLEGAVRRLREAAIDGDWGRATALGDEIGNVLFPPTLRAALARAGRNERLLLLLHGPLEGLPISLIRVGGQRLDDRLVSCVLPGLPGPDALASDDSPSGHLRANARWHLFGSPLAADSDEILLPGAAVEIARLARRHTDGVVATGATFVRAALVDGLRGTDPLHIATHLVAEPTCDDGRLAPVGLLLSGGDVLCAREILELRPRLPLVVLSACETAGGRAIDAEGTHGVARAFLEGGTRDLLVTLWPVEDGAAQRFAVVFHEELATGALPSVAARATRQRLRQRGHPAADWAAFRLMGRD